jgi:excisionase family DNA binding protein
MSQHKRAVEQHYSVKQAAALLGVHTNTVRNWIHERKLAAYALGRQVVRIPASALNEYLEARAL